MKTRSIMALVLGMSVLSLVSPAQAASLQWSGNCVTIDSSFYLCKPDDKWDTQKTEEALRPVKFVYHKGGANPVMWVVFDDSPNASSASDYASKVRARYESRGIKVDAVLDESTGGKSVYIVSGHDAAKGARFSTALFWRSGLRRVLQIEYTAAQDFSTYQPQFMATVSSARDLR